LRRIKKSREVGKKTEEKMKKKTEEKMKWKEA
jgi:hypothetical protein